jgi:hypothetical protein
VGDCGNTTEPGDEGCDLSAEDRRSIDQHLDACSSCCQYRTALEQALGALAGVAAIPPVPSDTPSLWSSLEARIEVHAGRNDARWSPVMHGPEAVDGGLRAWSDLDDERPLRSAWMRDSLREATERLGWYGGQIFRAGRLGESRSSPAARRVGRGLVPESRRRRGRVVGLSAVAAILAWVIGVAIVHRQEWDAESTILANAASRVGWVIAPLRAERERPSTRKPHVDRDLPAGELARAEPISVHEPPASGSDSPSGFKAAPPTRFGYDLEHGIPMPPDARESKSVY